MFSQANGQGIAGRKINNTCEESRESRAALVRMKCLGAFLTGASKHGQVGDRLRLRDVSLRLATREVRDGVEAE